jgi:catecholate siderophore receptor
MVDFGHSRPTPPTDLQTRRPATVTPTHRSALASSPLLPLGALAAGLGLLHLPSHAQTAPAVPRPAAAASAAPSASAASAPPVISTTLAPVYVRALAETDANSLRATTSTIGKGEQALRDIPQSVTVVTEKLMKDRRADTLKDALHQTAGISFQAAEGGEEDVRLRGFSLAASGDIYVDSLHDPAFYERDTFSYDRVELLRGSASMLFGRGSTGGVVNQVQKQAFLGNAGSVDATVGNAGFGRLVGDFNKKLGATMAARVSVMATTASNDGNKIDKHGVAPTLRWGIGTDDDWSLSGYLLRNDNGINYGIPWLRQDGSKDVSAANPAGLAPIDPRAYYGAASDINRSGAAYGTVGWTHRFAEGGGALKTAVRQGRYDRDQRASAIRYCRRTLAANGTVTNPDCPANFADVTTFGDATKLVRGTNNKVQDLTTTYAQSDYGNRVTAWGWAHEILAGIDLAHEVQNAYATVVPAGLVLDKNTPRLTIGGAGNGSGFVDEDLRIKRPSGSFDAKAVGVYAQDLLQPTDTIKVLGGLRYDRFRGDYRSYATAVTASTPVIGAETAHRARSDGLWSKRFGLLWQPSETASFHVSYGTSFNTSGDTYQYDALGSNTPPEGSENLELGAKVDWFDGRLSTRAAIFRSTKTNERNRDSDQGANQYLLSGKRHASGVELDIAGRIAPGWEVFGSYAWIPSARIDQGAADGTTLTQGELVGQRPSLTPRHSGTIWTTYQLTPQLRLGAGLNARSSQTPNRNPAGIVAPSWVTADLLAEYTVSDALQLKLNVTNATNKLYADALYTGHYVAGAPRAVQMTLVTRF